jgi:uncharacterized SAM-binding protein YcdF (DUF218 family)
MNQKKINEITNYIFVNSKPQRVDLALVFGTRHEEAIKKVYELYIDNYVDKILVSGGINSVSGENEAELMRKKLIELGVKPGNIIVENKSTNSLENVLFSKDIICREMGFNNIKKIIAVVKHYHSRRAIMTLKKHFPKTVDLLPIAYEIYGFTKDNWFEKEVGREKVMSEWEKISKYLAKGDIQEIK